MRVNDGRLQAELWKLTGLRPNHLVWAESDNDCLLGCWRTLPEGVRHLLADVSQRAVDLTPRGRPHVCAAIRTPGPMDRSHGGGAWMPGAASYRESNRRAWSLADTKVGERPQESSEVARGMALPEDPKYGLNLAGLECMVVYGRPVEHR